MDTTSDSSGPKTPSDPTLFASRGRAILATGLGVEPDDSTACLALVDHYLAGVPEDRPEMVALAASTMGAYFGELLVQHLNGTWQAQGGPSEWRIDFPVGLSISPVGMAAAAIVKGDPEKMPGYDATMDAHLGLQPLILQILSGMADVPADEYHTLTCRFETLELLLQALTPAAMAQDDAQEDEEGSVEEVSTQEATAEIDRNDDRDSDHGQDPF